MMLDCVQLIIFNAKSWSYYHEQTISRNGEGHHCMDEERGEVDAENGVTMGVADLCVTTPLRLLYGVVQTAAKHQHKVVHR